jgi:small-conductance mechanosensitive channel
LGAAGIVGLALGFAVRDTVENFIASVMLSIRQPFRPNDTVEINGDQGKVIRLTSRATILLSFDGNHIRIPNATVFKSRIINFTQNTERRFNFDLLVGRGEDISAARELVEATVQDLPFVLDEPAAATWIESIEAAGLRLQVTGWINQHETSMVLAQGEAIRQVKLALEAADITIVDAAQTIVLDRGAPREAVQAAMDTSKAQQETTVVAPVDAKSDDALERIIDAERHDETSEDLLRTDGLKE